MGKPRLIILIRHAQSEANVDKNIHQHTADHRVKLTPEGHEQSRAAGQKLRALLRSDDTLHFFISPYRRTRETTEGILTRLCADDPSPSPFRRSKIKVYEEPRLREQDFGNFQPNRDEVDRIWRERADYGHFFYRIPDGESGADCADRCSSFNESLWRRFGDADMASVAIIVSHGMVIRCFLMRWYHFSVEYFEDLRNINHVEFIVMRLKENGRYQLQNQLRTWSDLRKERAARNSISTGNAISSTDSSIPTRRTWACPEGCTNPDHGHDRAAPQRIPVRRNTADLFKDDTELFSTTPRAYSNSPLAHRGNTISEEAVPTPTPQPPSPRREFAHSESAETEVEASAMTLKKVPVSQGPKGQTAETEPYDYRGRDGGGSKSGATSPLSSTEEDEPYTDVQPLLEATSESPRIGSLARALRGELGGENRYQAMADALGDQSDAEVEEADVEMGDKKRQSEEEARILADERRDRGLHRTVY